MTYVKNISDIIMYEYFHGHEAVKKYTRVIALNKISGNIEDVYDSYACETMEDAIELQNKIGGEWLILDNR